MSKENKLYRNKISIKSSQGTEVDAGSLWERKKNIMVLVDDDQYVTSNETQHFKEA